MMHRSCDGCKYDLGGGRDNCLENVAYECRDGGGFEHWTPNAPETSRSEVPAANAHPLDASVPLVAPAFGSGATAIKDELIAVCGNEEDEEEEPQEEDFGGVDREYTEDCFMCGAKNGIKGFISGYNGHHRGVCSVCGIRFIE